MADLENERMRILEMIENGEISASDGLKLLDALNISEEADLEPQDEPLPPPPLADFPQIPEAPEVAAGPALPVIPVPPAPPTPPAPPLPVEEPDELKDLDELDEEVELEELEELSELDEPQEPEEPQEPASPRVEYSTAENGKTAHTAPEVLHPEGERESAGNFAQDNTIRRWRGFWQIPMWIGLGITLLAGIWMYQAYRASGVGFWFACAWFPFLIGVALMALAWASRSMRWLHVRIHQKPGERPQTIAISLPLPLRFSAWVVRTFGHRIPNIEGKGIDEMILAMEHTSPEAPFFIDVDEGDGEHVQIYIG